jgi:hypothetical protein
VCVYTPRPTPTPTPHTHTHLLGALALFDHGTEEIVIGVFVDKLQALHVVKLDCRGSRRLLLGCGRVGRHEHGKHLLKVLTLEDLVGPGVGVVDLGALQDPEADRSSTFVFAGL